MATLEALQNAIAHLDESSKAALRAAGRLVKEKGKARVRISYNPVSSRRKKKVVLPFVGSNEYVGVLTDARFKKTGLVIRVLDYARELVDAPGKPILTNMNVANVTNVVLLPNKAEEPRKPSKEAPRQTRSKAPTRAAPKAGKCKRCGDVIYWHKSKKGKWYATNTKARNRFHNCR